MSAEPTPMPRKNSAPEASQSVITPLSPEDHFANPRVLREWRTHRTIGQPPGFWARWLACIVACDERYGVSLEEAKPVCRELHADKTWRPNSPNETRLVLTGAKLPERWVSLCSPDAFRARIEKPHQPIENDEASMRKGSLMSSAPPHIAALALNAAEAWLNNPTDPKPFEAAQAKLDAAVANVARPHRAEILFGRPALIEQWRGAQSFTCETADWVCWLACVTTADGRYDVTLAEAKIACAKLHASGAWRPNGEEGLLLLMGCSLPPRWVKACDPSALRDLLDNDDPFASDDAPPTDDPFAEPTAQVTQTTPTKEAALTLDQRVQSWRERLEGSSLDMLSLFDDEDLPGLTPEDAVAYVAARDELVAAHQKPPVVEADVDPFAMDAGQLAAVAHLLGDDTAPEPVAPPRARIEPGIVHTSRKVPAPVEDVIERPTPTPKKAPTTNPSAVAQPRMTYEQYDALPGVRASRLKLLAKSPLHYHAAEDKDTASRGMLRAVHSLLLEPERFDEDYAVFSGRRAGKEYEAFAAGHDGCTILNDAEYEKARHVADGILRHPIARELLKAEGECERVFTWTHQPTRLRCKTRTDKWLPSRHTALDIKTYGTSDPREIGAKAAKLGAHIQGAHITEGIAAAIKTEPFAIRFLVIAAESAPPYDVAVCELLGDGAMGLGRRERDRLMALLADCERTNQWPGRCPSIVPLELPAWLDPAEGDSSTFDEEA